MKEDQRHDVNAEPLQTNNPEPEIDLGKFLISFSIDISSVVSCTVTKNRDRE